MMKEQINKGLLAYAVGLNISCSRCTKILDVDRAVLVTVQNRTKTVTRTICGRCWDSVKAPLGRDMAEQDISVDVIDGRELKTVTVPRR
jgi:hypothetical protein